MPALGPTGRPAQTTAIPPCLQAAGSRRMGAPAQVGRPAAAAARSRAAAAVRAQAEAAKASKAADLAAEVVRLKAENDALRAALAGYQQCGPAEVTLDAPAAAGEEGAAAAAGAGTLTKPTLPLAQQLEEGIQWPSPEEGSFWERPPRAAPLALAPPRGAAPSGQRDPRSVHVVHITAEMAPHAKVGGLGDVVTGLAKACLARGHNVEIMLPVRSPCCCWALSLLLLGAPAAAAVRPCCCCCWPGCLEQKGCLCSQQGLGALVRCLRGAHAPQPAAGIADVSASATISMPGSALANMRLFEVPTTRYAAKKALTCMHVALQYYECLPNDAIEDLRHERDIECPKASFAVQLHAALARRVLVWRGCRLHWPTVPGFAVYARTSLPPVQEARCRSVPVRMCYTLHWSIYEGAQHHVCILRRACRVGHGTECVAACCSGTVLG